jgi:endonuclease III
MNSSTIDVIRMEEIVSLLKIEYPHSRCSLNYQTPFQLLVSTILSAQCTDERVNKVTVNLFKKYPDAIAFSKLTISEIGKEIYSTGFYNNKAKSIKGMSSAIIEEHENKIPNTMDELISLPGVGRKTANVILGIAYNTPSLVVDTHVTRLSNLLGFVSSKNAVIIEKKLMKIVKRSDWTIFGHLLIDHGRAVCIARRPQCTNCILKELCISANSIDN